MARVTYGSGVTELAGSIGGVTYQKNASGNTARLRPNPTVNPTSLQAGYQGNMAQLVSFWPTLSQVNKDAWDTFAAAHDHTTPWGETKTLSGYQWFLSLNLKRLQFGYAVFSTPPAWGTTDPVPAFTLVATASYLRCEWTPNYDPLYGLAFYLSLPLRQSSLKLRRSLFFVHWDEDVLDMANYVLTSYFESLVGVTWADFYASADCSIICRILHIRAIRCITFGYTSAIVKI